jgi:hypothetical protein
MHNYLFRVIFARGGPCWPWGILGLVVMAAGGCSVIAGPVTYLPLRDLPAAPEKVPFAVQDGKVIGWAWKTLEGSVAVKTRVEAPGKARKHFEERLPLGEKVGLPGYERCHTHGRIWGVESPYSIFHAEREVNRKFQEWGIEEFVKKLNEQKRPGVEIWVTSESKARAGSTVLDSITYRIEATASASEKPAVLFETAFRMEKVRNSGSLTKSPSIVEVSGALETRKVLLDTPIVLNPWEHFLRIDHATMERDLRRLKSETGKPASEARPNSTETSREKAPSERKALGIKTGEAGAAHLEHRLKRPGGH